jgi:tRNA dimethylallyltransferase
LKTGDFFDIANKMEKRKIICIVGPTASGKTGWGVSIAKKFNGEIISADSRQVYQKLDIGTGKDLEEYGEVKYHLIDIRKPGEKFTLFDWLRLARQAVEDIFARGKTPVVVGGTGLYVQALTEGFELKKSTKDLKIKYSREQLEKKSLKQLKNILLKCDIGSSNIDLQNPHRIIRAIEKYQAGETSKKKKPNFEVLQLATDFPRDALYNRIDLRVEERFEQGMLEEIKSLIAAGVNKDWLLGLGLEYRIIGKYLLGQTDQSFLEMKQELKYKIHAFARRQLTWFRRFPEIVWCKDIKSAEKEIKKFLK